MAFDRSGAALILKYQTEVPIADTAALRTEAADIWRDYAAHADSAGVSGVVLSANAPPRGAFITRIDGINFVIHERRGRAMAPS